jgi:hypothetical protein
VLTCSDIQSGKDPAQGIMEGMEGKAITKTITLYFADRHFGLAYERASQNRGH